MLELRYNGCPDCLASAKGRLRQLGWFEGRDYSIEYHKEHSSDKIYQARPDYIKTFSGAILYNPNTESWIDFYTPDHEKIAIEMDESTKQAFRELKEG